MSRRGMYDAGLALTVAIFASGFTVLAGEQEASIWQHESFSYARGQFLAHA